MLLVTVESCSKVEANPQQAAKFGLQVVPPWSHNKPWPPPPAPWILRLMFGFVLAEENGGHLSILQASFNAKPTTFVWVGGIKFDTNDAGECVLDESWWQ